MIKHAKIRLNDTELLLLENQGDNLPSRPCRDVCTAANYLDRFGELSASLLSVSICCGKDWDLLNTSVLDKTLCAHWHVNRYGKSTRSALNPAPFYAE